MRYNYCIVLRTKSRKTYMLHLCIYPESSYKIYASSLLRFPPWFKSVNTTPLWHYLLLSSAPITSILPWLHRWLCNIQHLSQSPGYITWNNRTAVLSKHPYGHRSIVQTGTMKSDCLLGGLGGARSRPWGLQISPSSRPDKQKMSTLDVMWVFSCLGCLNVHSFSAGYGGHCQCLNRFL